MKFNFIDIKYISEFKIITLQKFLDFYRLILGKSKKFWLREWVSFIFYGLVMAQKPKILKIHGKVKCIKNIL